MEIAPGIDYQPQFLSESEQLVLFSALFDNTGWRQDSIKLFGKVHSIPRLQAFIAEPGVSYTYSGLRLTGTGFTEQIGLLKAQVEQACGSHFNAILANLYRNGQDSMGWHSDDEPELGPQPVVSILSLGARRTLRFRARNAASKTWGVDLDPGSLLIMRSGVQEHWQHSLPKRAACHKPRISLTFRNILH